MTLTWVRTHDWDADDWRDQCQLCRDSNPELFFPVGATGIALDQIDAGEGDREVCTVNRECLEFALATNQEAGVWGGTTEDERRKLRKTWLADQKASSFSRASLAPPPASPPPSPTGSCGELRADPVVTRSHVERPAELPRDERLDDRQPQPFAGVEVEPRREPDTVVHDVDVDLATVALEPHLHGPRDGLVVLAVGNAWLTAFCVSSLSTTASGVASSPGSSPACPTTSNRNRRRAHRLLHRARPAAGRSRRSPRTRARPARASRARSRSSGCAAPTPRSRSGLPEFTRRAWSRSSEAIVWRLFFTRWWISRIVASFDTSIRSRRRRSVTSRIITIPPADSGCPQRDPCTSTDDPPGSSPPSRGPGRVSWVHRGLVEADLTQPQAGRVRVDADPMQRAHRVRAREPDPAFRVQHDHAVTRPRGPLELDRRPRTESCPPRPCPRGARTRRRRPVEPPGRRPEVVAASTLTTTMTRPRRRTGTVSTRTRSRPRTTFGLAVVDLGVAPRAGERRPLHLVDHLADEVVHVERLAGGRAGPGRGSRTGARPRARPARTAAGRRTTGRRGVATTPRAARGAPARRRSARCAGSRAPGRRPSAPLVRLRRGPLARSAVQRRTRIRGARSRSEGYARSPVRALGS